MAYHELSECTLSPEERRQEANKITEIIGDSDIDTSDWTDTEKNFYRNVCNGGPVSVRQLFWLRDLKDKYL